jgi:hypothetical protein
MLLFNQMTPACFARRHDQYDPALSSMTASASSISTIFLQVVADLLCRLQRGQQPEGFQKPDGAPAFQFCPHGRAVARIT